MTGEQATQNILDAFPGAHIESHKDLRPQVEALSQPQREAYEERAAIIEEGEQVPRAQAERAAYARVAIINEAMSCAKIYAARGWYVFPVEPGGKKPLIKDWPNACTIKAAQIDEWWARWPNANIGLVTGRRSGVAVVDIDPRNGGLETWKDRWQGGASKTMASTAGGGWHIYYAAPPNTLVKSGANLLGPGVDVKGEGGYVVAPGSRTDAGEYKWHLPGESTLHAAMAATEQELTKFPLAFQSEMRPQPVAPHTKTSADDWGAALNGDVPAGDRNDSMTRLAGKLLSGGHWSPRAAYGLLAAFNALRCKPPLSPKELETIVRSIAQKEARK